MAALYVAPEFPSALTRPLLLAQVSAGFPSPADDYLDRDLDLHELLIQHPPSTFYVRLTGDSIQGAELQRRPLDCRSLATAETQRYRDCDLERRVHRETFLQARPAGATQTRQSPLPDYHRHAGPGAADLGRGDRQHPAVSPLDDRSSPRHNIRYSGAE